MLVLDKISCSGGGYQHKTGMGINIFFFFNFFLKMVSEITFFYRGLLKLNIF